MNRDITTGKFIKQESAKRRTLTFKVTDEFYTRFREFSLDQKISMTEVMELAVAEYIFRESNNAIAQYE